MKGLGDSVLSTNQKFGGSVPGSSNLHVEEYLGKILSRCIHQSVSV